MPKTRLDKSIQGQMVLLGTGTSVGVPAVGCGCAVCTSDDPRNNRTRASAILGLPGGNLLIDTSPDLRQQLLREKIGIVHSVVYTHEHADHVFGLDDLRLMQFYLKGPVPLYCESFVEKRIRQSFDYAFIKSLNKHAGAVPQLTIQPIGLEPFDVLGTTVTPVRLKHGPHFDVLGFRVGNIAYCTDVKEIPDDSKAKLQGLEVLVLDALRDSPSATHMTLDEAVETARELGAKQTYFTHIAHELDYTATNAKLPDGMQLAYDGLRFQLT